MNTFFKLTLLILFSLISVSAQVDDPEITVVELEEHVKYLASEELGGRKPGTEGGKKAAEYIRDELAKNDLSLLGDNGFQYFEILNSLELGTNNLLSFDDVEGKVGEDFMPFTFSENGEVETGVVFAGYGFIIETDTFVWNDYKDLDVEDKLVIVLRSGPGDDSHDSEFFGHTDLRKKIMRAKDKGAAGVIFVSGKEFDETDELIDLSFEKRSPSVGIYVFHAKRNFIDKLLQPYDINIEALEKYINENREPYTFELAATIKAGTDLNKIYEKTQNVVGMIEGADPMLKDEYIILGAHYDHLGMGGPGSGSRQPDTSAVHYGADDNASGSAAVLEIVERLANNRDKIKRSILFIAFGAEEMGLIGSKHFINNPLVDLTDVYCMLNFDMVGRLDPEDKGLTIGGSGTSAEFESMLTSITEKSGLSVRLSPEGYGPSDHASFYGQDIPVLFFFTGVHEDYHTPRDTYLTLNYEGGKSVADLGYDIISRLASRSESLTFQEAGPKEPQTGQYRFKVTLGIMPDVSGADVKGLRADAVIEGRPAYRAGMQKGDIIVSMDGKTVNDIYEYMNRLSDFKPGQRISVEVMRDGEKVILIVDL